LAKTTDHFFKSRTAFSFSNENKGAKLEQELKNFNNKFDKFGFLKHTI